MLGLGRLPIRSSQWSLTYEQTYCSCRCYCLSQFWNELVYFFPPLNAKNSPSFQVPLQPVQCKISGILLVCTWYLGGKVSPAELWSVGADTQQQLLHLPSIRITLLFWTEQGLGSIGPEQDSFTRHSMSHHPWGAISAHSWADLCNCLALLHLRPI